MATFFGGDQFVEQKNILIDHTQTSNFGGIQTFGSYTIPVGHHAYIESYSYKDEGGISGRIGAVWVVTFSSGSTTTPFPFSPDQESLIPTPDVRGNYRADIFLAENDNVKLNIITNNSSGLRVVGRICLKIYKNP